MTTRLIGRTGRRIALLSAALLALATAAAAQPASQAQGNAIRQACPADYRAHCAAVPAGGKSSLDCLQRNLPSLSPACRRAVEAVGGGATAHPAPSSGAAANPPARSSGAAATAAAPVAGPTPAAMTPREEIALLRQSCGGDFRALCPGVPLGGGRAIACLRAHAGALSPRCGGALNGARQNR